MYEVIYTGQFKRSLKLCVRRGLDVTIFTKALDILQEKGELPQETKLHKILIIKKKTSFQAYIYHIFPFFFTLFNLKRRQKNAPTFGVRAYLRW